MKKFFDAFAPYHHDEENHIDSLTPLLYELRLTKTTWRSLFANFWTKNIKKHWKNQTKTTTEDLDVDWKIIF